MTKSMSAYCDAFSEFRRKLAKKLDDNDATALKYASFLLGLLLASWFPKFTKKCKALFVMVGIVMMIPVAIKAVNTFKEVFKYRWW